MRSALDHLMSSLVAPKDRGSAMFPIFFEGVWEAIVPGENQQRIKERLRWASDIKTLPDDAVTVLKRLQPPDLGIEHPQPALLTLINRLSNRDRHEKLAVVVAGMSSMRVEFVHTDGTPGSGPLNPDPNHILQNNAEILDLPEDVMDVKVHGTSVVGVQLGNDRFVEIPSRLRIVVESIDSQVIAPLVPFVRR
jgi:hypothetical protein